MYVANMQVIVEPRWDGIYFLRFITPDRTAYVQYQFEYDRPTMDQILSFADDALLKLKGTHGRKA